MREATPISVRSQKLLALLALIPLAAFAGCGSGSDETAATSDPPTTASTTAGGVTTTKKDAEKSGKGGSEGTSSGSATGGTQESPGSSSGADRSIQEFGDAGDDATAQSMEQAVRGYFGALAANKPAKACTFLAPGSTDQFEAMLEQAATQQGSDQKLPRNPCKVFLGQAAAAYSGDSGPDIDSLTFVDFRVDGDRGFALYKLSGRPKSFIPLAEADGRWTVAAIDGSALP